MKNEWFSEASFHETHSVGFKLKSVLHTEQSKYQKITVLDTYSVGKLLLLDDKCMVSQADEFVYHEVVSHIPYMCKPVVKNVLIIGGGDCGVVREFARHCDIERIDLVEIDERVVEVSKKYFPECTVAMDDKRVNLYTEDGIEFIKNKKNEYDIIVIDSTDPEDFALGLFTKEFYKHVHDALVEDGIMINQTENPFLDEFGINNIYSNMRGAFPIVKSFSAPMLIYPGVYWTFGFSSKKYRPTNLISSKISNMLSIEKDLKWYNTQWHQGTFLLSNLHKRAIDQW